MTTLSTGKEGQTLFGQHALPSEDGQTTFGQPAPILLVGFNRPEMLRGLVGILAKARPPKLYLAVDGPREGHPSEAEKCAECSAVLDGLDWPCEVKKLIREKNLGCRMGVSSALDWFFDNEEEGIILEDDCWPGISFLRFATELLERYRDDSRVGIVSGYNAYGFISDKNASYRFTRHVHIWGWATWRRIWWAYRADPEAFISDMDSVFRRCFETRRGRILAKKYWNGYLQSRDTWDIPFALWVHGRELLSAMPRCNLVANVGGQSYGATHTTGFSYDERLSANAQALEFPMVHPQAVECDNFADRLHERRSFAWLPRILTIVGLRSGRIGRAICSIASHVEKLCPPLFRV